MSVSSDSSISDQLRDPAAQRVGGAGREVPPPRIGETDGELLRLFLGHGDHDALDRVIARHAPMVWRVCHQQLRRQQDAEDAFQATFLLLVRHAKSIHTSESAAGWLYRVAYRTSIRARKKLASRREESLALDPLAPPEVAFPDLEGRQTAGVLIEELMQLPTKYQAPLVMRYLEGQSRRAIADQTDSTVPAVQGRLARGKQLLRRRLVRRGVSLSAAMAVLAGKANPASAGAPSHAVALTASNAGALASGASLAASTAVVSLYQEGVRAMLIGWIAKPAAVAAAAALLLVAPSMSGDRAPDRGGAHVALIDARVDAAGDGFAPEVMLAQANPVNRRRESSEQPAGQVAPPTRVGGSPIASMPPAGTVTGFVRPVDGSVTATPVNSAGAPPPWTVLGQWGQGGVAAMQYGDMGRDGRKLSDSAQSEFLLKQWAEAAAKNPPPADGKPSAKELHTWHTHWDSRYHALRNQFEQMTRRFQQDPEAAATDEGRAAMAQAELVAAEVFKARAEALRYERELKQLALAKSRRRQPRPDDPTLAFADALNLTVWGGAGEAMAGAGGEIDEHGVLQSYYGSIPDIGGKTLPEAAAAIAEFVRQAKGDPNLRVRVEHDRFGVAGNEPPSKSVEPEPGGDRHALAFPMLKLSPSDQKEARPAPKALLELFEDQSPVSMQGYIRPDSIESTTGFREFVLVKDNQQSSFGDLANVPYHDRVLVRLPKGRTLDFTPGLIDVHGTLALDPQNAGVGAHPSYLLNAERVESVDPASPHGGMAVGEWKPTPTWAAPATVDTESGIPLQTPIVDGPGIEYGEQNRRYGWSVLQLQERLNGVLDPSPGLTVDGDYGPKTTAAVARFQEANGLDPDGFADAATRKALGFADSAPASKLKSSALYPVAGQWVPGPPQADGARRFLQLPPTPATGPPPAPPEHVRVHIDAQREQMERQAVELQRMRARLEDQRLELEKARVELGATPLPAGFFTPPTVAVAPKAPVAPTKPLAPVVDKFQLPEVVEEHDVEVARAFRELEAWVQERGAPNEQVQAALAQLAQVRGELNEHQLRLQAKQAELVAQQARFAEEQATRRAEQGELEALQAAALDDHGQQHRRAEVLTDAKLDVVELARELQRLEAMQRDFFDSLHPSEIEKIQSQVMRNDFSNPTAKVLSDLANAVGEVQAALQEAKLKAAEEAIKQARSALQRHGQRPAPPEPRDPSTHGATDEQIHRSDSMNHLKDLSLALLNYHETYDRFPRTSESGLSWRVELLPLLGHDDLYGKFHLDEPWDSPHNKALIAEMPDDFLDPGGKLNASDGKTHYLAVVGERGFLSPTKARRLQDFVDGTSNTISLVQVNDARAVEWTRPSDFDLAAHAPNPRDGIGSLRKGGFLAAYADGHISLIGDDKSAEELRAELTIDDGSPEPSPFGDRFGYDDGDRYGDRGAASETPPESHPVGMDPLSSLEQRFERAQLESLQGSDLCDRAYSLFRSSRNEVANAIFQDSLPTPTWGVVQAQAAPGRLERLLWEKGNALLAEAAHELKEIESEVERLVLETEQSDGVIENLDGLSQLAIRVRAPGTGSPVSDVSANEAFAVYWENEYSSKAFFKVAKAVTGNATYVSDQLSREQLRQFQSDQGLDPTGEFDEATWNALFFSDNSGAVAKPLEAEVAEATGDPIDERSISDKTRSTQSALEDLLSFIPGVKVKVRSFPGKREGQSVEHASVVVPEAYVDALYREKQTDDPEGRVVAATFEKLKTEVRRQIEEIVYPLLPRLPLGEDEYKNIKVTFARSVAFPSKVTGSADRFDSEISARPVPKVISEEPRALQPVVEDLLSYIPGVKVHLRGYPGEEGADMVINASVVVPEVYVDAAVEKQGVEPSVEVANKVRKEIKARIQNIVAPILNEPNPSGDHFDRVDVDFAPDVPLGAKGDPFGGEVAADDPFAGAFGGEDSGDDPFGF